MCRQVPGLVVEECADDGRLLMPPDRETDKHSVYLCKIDIHRFQGRAERWIEMFLSAARLLVGAERATAIHPVSLTGLETSG